ncbi:MAG: peptidase S41 [Rhodospirillaceae bacterium]|nr:peptidase S41 [Rhodospirillaceae bacterium]HAA93967.1 peptidase S41 [Rhodospirillaceae bacterium]
MRLERVKGTTVIDLKNSGYAKKLRKQGGLIVILSALLVGATPVSSAEPKDKTDTYRLLELFGDVFERVRNDYVEKISDEDLIEAAIEGMLGHLDPHSNFLNKKKFKEMKVQTRGEFGGLGIEVTMDRDSGMVRVVSPIDDTPAFRAGLKAGDLISHLNGKPVRGLSLSQAVERMRGRINTDINLTIRRVGAKPFDVTITRASIRIQSVRSRTEGKVGYIRITSFTEQTTRGLKKALKRLREKIGEDIKGYILDLRNNPGGLLEQAVNVSNVFLNQGEIVSTRGRHEESAQRFQATKGDVTGGLPLVVLINGGSASASEIVAGALQDHRRAIVLGTKSFGKGSVQTIIPLGQSGAIKMTTQRYYTPSGRSIQAKGINPDISVKQAKLEIIDRPRRRSEANLRNSLKNEEESKEKVKESPEKSDEEKKPETDKSVEKKEEKSKPDKSKPVAKRPKVEDYQLSRALDLLRGLSLFQQTRAGATN